jgi:hypothetical protein
MNIKRKANRMTLRCAAIVLAWSVGISAMQVPNLSGTWSLNVNKSRWGKHPKPGSGRVTIEHQEPVFKYSGMATFQSTPNASEGEATKTFGFNGAIDGKSYAVTGDGGEGGVSIKRVNANTIVSDFESTDGKLSEKARMTLSAGGKVLIREIRANGANGEMSWTEVYDRR